jgi:hypothetical protein
VRSGIRRQWRGFGHVADKICAMYERHGENAQFGSVRHRDLANVLVMGQQDSVRGQAVTQALHREAERRRHNGIAMLPTTFETPGSDWHDNYPK